MKTGKGSPRSDYADHSDQQLEAELIQTAQDRFAKIFSANPAAIVLTRIADGTILDVNDAFLRLTGYRREELIGKTTLQLGIWGDPANREKTMRLLQEKGRFRDQELKLYVKGGESLTVTTSAEIIEVEGESCLLGMFQDLTDRKATEEALRKSEEKYRDLVDLLPQIIFEMDTRGNLTYVNKNATDILGYSLEEVEQGMNALDTIAPWDRQRARDNIQRVCQGERLRNNEYTMLRKDGSPFYVMIHSNPVIQDGRVTGLRGIIVDITERKNAEDEAHKLAEQYRHLFERNLAGVYRTTPDGRILECNESFARILGYDSPADVLSANAASFYEQVGNRERFLQELREKRVLTNLEQHLKRKDGSALWVIENVSLIPGDTPGSEILEGTLVDITERKKAADELRKFKLGLEKSSEVIFITDVNGIILYANAAFETVYGFTKDETLGKTPRILKSGMLPPEAYAQLWQALLAGQTLNSSGLVNKTKDGRLIHIEGSANPILNEDGQIIGFLAVQRDVTERKIAEQTLQQLSNRQNAILASVPDIIAEVDENKTYTWLNKAGLEFFGEDAIGRSAAYYFEGEQKTFELVQPLFSGSEEIIYLESWQRRKDGEKRLLAWWCRVLKDENGAAKGALSTARDITGDKRVEETLRLTQFSVDHAADAIFWIGRNAEFLYVNDAACQSLGYSRDELLKMRVHDISPTLTEEVWQGLWDKLKACKSFTAEAEHRARDGRIYPVEISANYLEINGKEYDFAFCRDISERKRGELSRDILRRIGEAVALTGNLDDLMKTIHENIERAMYADNCYIALYDAKTETVSFPFFVDQQDETPAPRARKRGFTEYVLRTGQPLLLTPEKSSELIRNGEVETIGTLPNAYLAVPLFIHTEPIGVLVVQSYDDEHRYSPADQEMLSAIGHLAAYAIERRLSEDELKKSEEKYRTLVDNIQDGVFIIQDSRLRYLNSNLARMFGYSVDELIGKDFRELVAPEDLDMVVKNHAQRMSGVDTIHEYDFKGLRKDGYTRFVVHMNVGVITYQGRPAAMGTLKDFTDRKQREMEREAILNVNKMLLGELDTERALRSLGQELRELVPHNVLALSLIKREEDRVDLILATAGGSTELDGYVEVPGNYFETYQGSLTQQIIYDRRNRIQSVIPENGARFERNLLSLGMKSYLAVPLVNVGVPLGMLFLAHEKPDAFNPRHEQLLQQIQPQLSLYIQHQRLIERVLDSESKYRRLFDNSHDIIYILQEKRFVYVNPRFEELLEYRLEEVSQPDFDFIKLVAPESIPLIEERTRRLAAGEKLPPNYEFKAVSKSGQVLDVDVSVSYITYEGKPAVQGILRDVTEKKHLESRQKEMQLELIQHAKLSSIGMLAAGIAHNVNVPLQGLINHIELLKLTRDDLPYVEDMLNQAQRIGAIINNMLFKSRQEQDQETRAINLNQLLVEELNFLNADLVFKHRIQKEYKFDPNLPALQGVYSDFSQALLNIIKNALDAMHDSSVKRLGVKTQVTSEGEIMVQVSDTGCGIPAEHLPHIFDPFFSTKPSNGKTSGAEPTGTGLGLSSAYQLLKKYNARMEVDSEVGKGTTFRVFIPPKVKKPTPDLPVRINNPEPELVEA